MKYSERPIIKRTKRDYNLGFKLAVISQVEKGEMTYKQAQKDILIRYRPWTVIHVEFYKTKKEAILREKFLKSGVGRTWIKKQFLGGEFISA